MQKRIILSLVTAVFVFPSTAQAISKKISSPYVTKGEVEIENFGNLNFEDGERAWKNSTEVEYGITDYLNLAIGGTFEKSFGGEVEYDDTEFEATIQLNEKNSPIVDAGIQFAYELSGTGGADKIEAKLLLRKNYKKWQHKANLAVEHEVGEGREEDLETGLAWGSYYKLDGFKLGGEYFADFGAANEDKDYDKQKHQIGPVIGFDLPVASQEVEIKVGYLQGISSAAPNSAVKYELEVKF